MRNKEKRYLWGDILKTFSDIPLPSVYIISGLALMKKIKINYFLQLQYNNNTDIKALKYCKQEHDYREVLRIKFLYFAKNLILRTF